MPPDMASQLGPQLRVVAKIFGDEVLNAFKDSVHVGEFFGLVDQSRGPFLDLLP
jgi:hypothetical protein